MTTRTLSEYLFERFCDERRIPYRRIPETKTRTPDYELFPEGTLVVAEVKEIEPNREELEAERIVREEGVGPVVGHEPGDRLRLKIAASSKQIKARAQGQHPSLLVVFNEGHEIPHLESYSVRVAMYGLEQVYVAVPQPGLGSPRFAGMGYGPKRKMTPTDNTSISAIGALVMNSHDDIRLVVYHNRYAKVPLPTALLGQYAIRQFQLGPDTPGRTADWSEISTDRKRLSS